MKIRVASAGTGKTAWLTRRFLELIAQGLPLYRIAGVTFTNRAAAELALRLERGLRAVLQGEAVYGFQAAPAHLPLFQAALQQLEAAPLGTIHRFMGRCLRLAAPLVNLDPDFELLGDGDAQLLFEETLRSLQFMGQSLAPPGFEAALGVSWNSACKQLFQRRSQSPVWLAGEGLENQQLLEGFDQIMAAYRLALGPRRLDLAELELRALQAVQSPRAGPRLVQRFPQLLVDEYQDVNPVQGAFFAALEQAGCQIEAVGDPKQAVYEFREANLEVFRQARQRAQELGQEEASLTTTYRHGQVLTRFLNRLGSTMGKQHWGFALNESPTVATIHSELGHLEVHWIVGSAGANLLRQHEARVVAARLQTLSNLYPPQQMAVLVRSRHSLPLLEEALRTAGLPFAEQQGRGLYARNEIRDLYNALMAGLDPQGLPLAAWLRSPWVGLSLASIDRVLQASQPLTLLETHHPQVFRQWKALRSLIQKERPIEVIRTLLREPLEGGQTYPERLDQDARENLDWLLFEYHRRPPATIELLLQRLEQLQRQADLPVVPQGGAGIQLLTIHGAKGLEWPVVAVFDLIRNPPPTPTDLVLAGGKVFLPGTPAYPQALQAAEERRRQEQYRLLYVAVSRGKKVLLLSGSPGDLPGPNDWLEVMQAMQLGPEHPLEHPQITVQTHTFRQVLSSPQPVENHGLAAAWWSSAQFEAGPFPPVYSPSALRRHNDLPEELPGLPDPQEGEVIPQRSQAVGTLVHYALGQNWEPERAQHLHNLEAQEVMFPFDPQQRAEIMQEVVQLWRNYQNLLGTVLPWPRDEDYPELPLLWSRGGTVWQGVADRVYRVAGQWFLDDYKTDWKIQPEQYHFQLAVYQQALQEAWGVKVQARLIYLRHQQVLLLEDHLLQAALQQELAVTPAGPTAPPAPPGSPPDN